MTGQARRPAGGASRARANPKHSRRRPRAPLSAALAAALPLALAAALAFLLLPAPAAVAQPAAGEWFTEQAAATGLDFVHFNGMSGQFFFEEMVGSGAALLDYDNDGDLDVYLVQGAMLGEGLTVADATIPPAMPLPLNDRLYRNDLRVDAAGRRTLRFTDVTEAAGLDLRAYGMGVATGDYDNDGWVDLYLTRRGPDALLRNAGDGTFRDVTAAAGLGQPGWSISASFVDYDRDGWLDLYVGNYVDHDPDRECTTDLGARDYCGPQGYMSTPDRLYRNLGDGSFADVTAAARVAAEFGPAMGVVAADLNLDGWPDLYVANDMQENLLWVNTGDGAFRNDALLAGTALNQAGAVEAGMGVDAGDIDNDGDDDLFLTHLDAQTNTLYVNDGGGFFEDRSTMSGLGAASVPSTGFGALWFDFDNDGWLDVLAANGAVTTVKELVEAGDPHPLHEPNQLWRNTGGGRFADVTAEAGAAFALSDVSRGAAFGDIDNDGDTDVIITNNAGPVRLLINEVGSRNHWLGLRLVGGDPPRDMLGARVGVFRAGEAPLWRRARTDGSYASAHDPRVIVGLGDAPAVERVQVVWPGGRVEEWTGLAADGWHTLTEGAGTEAGR